MQKNSWLFVAIFFVFSACTSSENSTPPAQQQFSCDYTVVAKGNRAFGMDILDTTSAKTYNDNLTTLQELSSFQTLHLTWDAIEGAGSGTTSGTFTDPGGALAAFDNIAATQGIKLSLTIRPIDATGKTVPADLISTKFQEGSNIMATRFKKMLDFVLTKIDPSHLTAIFIGNEIDNYNPGSDSNFWSDYGAFLNQVRYSIANTSPTYPTLKIGFTATSEGLIDTSKTLALGSNSVQVMKTYAGLVDIVGVTYYPLNSDFTVKPTSVVTTDFANLTSNYTTLSIQEVGYPSSETDNSSEESQARFFCEVFHAWDTHSSQIPYMAALRMNDITLAQAQSMAVPYGISSETFIEYLRTLGIIKNDGTPKQAKSLILQELAERGF